MGCLLCASTKGRDTIDSPTKVDVIAYANGEIELTFWNKQDRPKDIASIRFRPEDWLKVIATSVEMTNPVLYKMESKEANKDVREEFT